MTKKSLGYVELEWECPNCGGRNPGTQKICTNCGTAQPQDVKFEQAAEERIIKDATIIKRAAVGPDIHCAYCGTRNPGNAQTCSQCGADLAEGTVRDAGEVLGVHKDKPAKAIKCEFCGTMNPGTARKCENCGANLELEKPKPAASKPKPKPARRSLSTIILAAIGVFIVAACIGLIIFMNQTDDVQGEVSDLSWKRSIVIMGLAPVSRAGWRDEIPTNAEIGQCQLEQRFTSDEPQPNSQEVCGTPYTVDTGSGLGEVVQDCVYEVYDDRCDYTVLEMRAIDTLVREGSDRDPQWPAAALQADQEEGEREESYRIVFSADGETFVYTTSDVEEYQDFTLGSNWTLKVNPLGGVIEVEPAS